MLSYDTVDRALRLALTPYTKTNVLTAANADAIRNEMLHRTPKQAALAFENDTLDGFAFVASPADYNVHRFAYIQDAERIHDVTYGPVDVLGATGFAVTPLYAHDGRTRFLFHTHVVEKQETLSGDYGIVELARSLDALPART